MIVLALSTILSRLMGQRMQRFMRTFFSEQFKQPENRVMGRQFLRLAENRQKPLEIQDHLIVGCHREASRMNRSLFALHFSSLFFAVASIACVSHPAAPNPTIVPPASDVPVLLPFPPRPADALDGDAFLASLAQADENQVQQASLHELLRGNVPESLRRLSRIAFEASTRSGLKKKVTIWVTWDYVSIGSDANSIRIPLTPISAQLLADQMGALLPTRKIVDILYQYASLKLSPHPFPPGPWMVRPAEFLRHDKTIDEELSAAANEARSWPPLLLAGHKKDIVLSNVLEERRHRLAIYGWHTLEGKPIQSVSTYHGDWYADYSHGTRLIAKTMRIDQHIADVDVVLKDDELASLLSDEGPLLHTRYRTEDGPGRLKWWPKLPEESK